MTNRITLLCVPATAALRAGRFPADEPLDTDPCEHLASLAQAIHAIQADHVLCSPARSALDTARALGLSPTPAPALREVDYGRWTGLSLKEVAAAEPEAIAAWLSDPAMDAHGGESLDAAIARVGQWAGHCQWDAAHTLILAPASAIKAFLLHALQAPARVYWQLDIAPLTLTTLSVHQDTWRLMSAGVPAGPR